MAMVCLKNNSTGEIIRVEKHKEATQYMKKAADWSFCSKAEWKKLKGKPTDGTQV